MGDSQSSFQGSVPTSAVTATENAGAIDVPPQAPPTPSAKSTALAAYLTTISNIARVRADRVWKRFVRVRTDDLESVRVERAIKRVRSDLAAHVGGVSSKDKENVKAADGCEGVGVLEGYGEKHEEYDEHMAPNSKKETEDETKLEINQEKEEQDLGHPTKETNATESTLTQENINEKDPSIAEGEEIEDGRDPSVNIGTEVPADRVTGEEAGQISTPLASEVPSRIPRSHSAEPDKSHRFSRSFASSVPSQSGAESQTGDDSSSSAAAAILMGSGKHRENRKKRRSHSRVTKEPKEPRKSLRKVCVDDFEMTRVLGKGCAGKVLLVRQKSTTELFALKAITKRHVLAHQELQHTLTEQAVLKRMAAENRDPFVVKLWWSFHDKDNLFLVMVCCLV
jgi:serum/glucocorticoid-regulated kinase 2